MTWRPRASRAGTALAVLAFGMLQGSPSAHAHGQDAESTAGISAYLDGDAVVQCSWAGNGGDGSVVLFVSGPTGVSVHAAAVDGDMHARIAVHDYAVEQQVEVRSPNLFGTFLTRSSGSGQLDIVVAHWGELYVDCELSVNATDVALTPFAPARAQSFRMDDFHEEFSVHAGLVGAVLMAERQLTITGRAFILFDPPEANDADAWLRAPSGKKSFGSLISAAGGESGDWTAGVESGHRVSTDLDVLWAIDAPEL